MKKKLLTIIGALALLAGAYLFINRPSQAIHAHEGIAPQLLSELQLSQAQIIQNEVSEEEKKIWQSIQTHGITQEKVASMVKRLNLAQQTSPYEAYKSDAPISEATYQRIEKVCNDFGVDYQTLKICSIKTSTSPAAADDTGIYVNEELLQTFNEDVQTFIIGHELQHYIFKDDSYCVALENLLNGKDQELVNAFSRFVENRADAMASIKGADYAHGQKAFMEHLLKHYGDVMAPSHPANTARIAMADKIITTIHA